MAKEDHKGRARSRLIEDAQELETSLDALLDEQPVAPGPAGAPVSEQPLRFERLRVLGVGATAEVYEAWDCHLERHVALKVAVGERARGRALRMERFLHEVRVTARLDHPAIVPIFDAADLEAPQAWFAMRRVRGLTLAQAIIHHHSGDTSWGLPASRGRHPTRRRGHRLRPWGGRHPPGPQAREHSVGPVRRGSGGRLGFVPGAR